MTRVFEAKVIPKPTEHIPRCEDKQMSKSGIEKTQNENREELRDQIGTRMDIVDTYLKITRSTNILRRYFVINAFDGAMTSLGVIIGAYITNIDDPRGVIGLMLVSAVAMAVSGFTGTYMTESAERIKSLNDLEDSMLIDMSKTDFGKANRFVSLIAAVVDGLAPFLASIPCILPFTLSLLGLLSIHSAFYIAIAGSLLVLFVLGFYLGKISKGNVILSGIKMVVAGSVVALIAIFLGGE
jgi:predicted membrane protein (TIGR00267 family)